MKQKHQFFNLYRKYVWLLSRFGKNVPLGSAGSRLYIITIAYNHAKLIEKQIELLKKYGRDENYRHVIVDNSPQRSCRRQIKQICEREDVDYVGVPLFIDRLISHKLFGNGLSHGAALNWMFYHVLKINKPERFALLDHDIFPLNVFSLIEILGLRDFYGVERNKGIGWYLWPGWCVFMYDIVEKCRPNFLPIFVDDVYFDSGGGNYEHLYSHYPLCEMEFPDVVTKRVKKTEGLYNHNDIYHADCIQYIDHIWLHVINGSNCADIPGKEDFVDYILNNMESLYE